MNSMIAAMIPQIKPQRVAIQVQFFIRGKRQRESAKTIIKFMRGYTINFQLERMVLIDICFPPFYIFDEKLN